MSEVEDTVEDTGPKMAKKATGIESSAALSVLATENPKREESQAWERFQGYFTLSGDATVQNALDAGLTMGDIKYDFIHGYIEVDGATVEEYEVTPRGAKSDDDEGEDEEVGSDTEEASGF